MCSRKCTQRRNKHILKEIIAKTYDDISKKRKIIISRHAIFLKTKYINYALPPKISSFSLLQKKTRKMMLPITRVGYFF